MGLVVHLLIAPLVSRENRSSCPTRASFHAASNESSKGISRRQSLHRARRADRIPEVSRPHFGKTIMPRSAWVALLFGVITTSLLVVSVSRLAAQEARDEDHAHAHAHDEEMSHGEYDYEAPPRRQESMLMWTFNALGWRYTLALRWPAAGLVLALAIVLRGGPNAGPALLFVVPIPLLVGVLGFF